LTAGIQKVSFTRVRPIPYDKEGRFGQKEVSMTRTLGRLVCLTMLFLAGPATAAEVTIKTVSYEDVGRSVRENKGKVVVVAFWNFT
jgi:hypothetical protein